MCRLPLRDPPRHRPAAVVPVSVGVGVGVGAGVRRGEAAEEVREGVAAALELHLRRDAGTRRVSNTRWESKREAASEGGVYRRSGEPPIEIESGSRGRACVPCRCAIRIR